MIAPFISVMDWLLYLIFMKENKDIVLWKASQLFDLQRQALTIFTDDSISTQKLTSNNLLMPAAN